MGFKIEIGHAAGNEHAGDKREDYRKEHNLPDNDGINGGEPGDQSQLNPSKGYEVYPGMGYNKEVVVSYFTNTSLDYPTVLIRPKTDELAENLVKVCREACDNPYIGYDQNKRNTLYEEASKVGFDFTKIKTFCSTDCSAFMGVCAVAAGSSFDYYAGGGNGPYTSNMKSRFSNCDDFDVTEYTNTSFLRNPNNLEFGDILVHEGKHAFMILQDGPKGRPTSYDDITATDAPDNDANVSVDPNAFIYRLEVLLNNISSNKVSGIVDIFVVKNGLEEKLKDLTWLKNYDWNLETIKLSKSSTNAINTTKLTMKTASTDFNITGLTSNCSYSLRATAKQKNGDDKMYSSTIIFNTTCNRPKPVKDFKVTFDSGWPHKKCFVSFDKPDDWVSGSGGYRVSLIINGKIINYSDDLINSEAKNKGIKLSSLLGDKQINDGDIVQIGIQTWVDIDGMVIFDSDFPKCSKPLINSNPDSLINKTYIKIGNKYKQVIVHDNLRSD